MKRGRGRPKSRPGEGRTERIEVRLRPDEFAALDAARKRAGMTLAAYIRSRLGLSK